MTDHLVVDNSADGKTVVNADGKRIGVVSGVEAGTAYVDPDPGITDKIKTTLGWEDVDEDDYPLPEASIERITEDEIHLQRNY